MANALEMRQMLPVDHSSSRGRSLVIALFAVFTIVISVAALFYVSGKTRLGGDQSIAEVIENIRFTANDETGLQILSSSSRPAKCYWDGKWHNGRAVSVRWREKNRVGALELWDRDFFIFNKADAKRMERQITSDQGIASWILGSRVQDYQRWEEISPEERERREKEFRGESEKMSDEMRKRNPPQKTETELPPPL